MVGMSRTAIRIGQCAGKQDAGHRHAGVYAISRKRLMGGIAKQLKADRDAGRIRLFRADAGRPVAHRGAAKENSLENSSGRESFSGRLSGEFLEKWILAAKTETAMEAHSPMTSPTAAS